MYGTARATGYGYSLWEFQVYGTGGSRRLRHHQRGAGQPGHRVLHRERRHAGLGRGRRQHRHPLVQRLQRPAVAPGRPRHHPAICQVVLNWEAAYGKAFQIQASTDGDRPGPRSTHHHRHRRHADARRLRHRPLHPDVRHRPRPPRYGYSLWEFAVHTGTAGDQRPARRRRPAARPRAQRASSSTRRCPPRPSRASSTRSSPQQETNQFGTAALRVAVQAGHLQRSTPTSASTPRSPASA